MLQIARNKYNQFIDSCYVSGEGYKLTANSEISPYALCFAIFGKYLIGQLESISNEVCWMNTLLRRNLDEYRNNCLLAGRALETDKGYLQLLTFTLSAMSITDSLDKEPLDSHVIPLVNKKNVIDVLKSAGTFIGRPGTGNLAMFYAILLIYSEKHLSLDTSEVLKKWQKCHIKTMNCHGFWGNENRPLYLQFQNGYHQYEIFEYLGVTNDKSEFAANFVYSMSDKNGHFAPYPGGGGCYDYDAVFVLTFLGQEVDLKHKKLLNQTFNTILSEQNNDGGYAESRYVRPKNLANIKIMLRHIIEKGGYTRIERARYCLSLLRSKHNRISTHWTKYSRDWNESNLWDSWFRMLTIARIDQLSGENEFKWGFIDFPGIGYNYMLCNSNKRKSS